MILYLFIVLSNQFSTEPGLDTFNDYSFLFTLIILFLLFLHTALTVSFIKLCDDFHIASGRSSKSALIALRAIHLCLQTAFPICLMFIGYHQTFGLVLFLTSEVLSVNLLYGWILYLQTYKINPSLK